MNTPMPLPVAVRECFPHGGATVSTLRRAIRNGELAAELIGKQYMVTEDDIAEWRENTCRVRARDRGSISGSVRGPRPSTSSETERMRSAQDALTLLLQPNGSKSTSPGLSDRKRASGR